MAEEISTKHCRLCGGDGIVPDGLTCPRCDGSGTVYTEASGSFQLEWNVKYVAGKVDELETKIEAIAVQVQALYDDLNP